MRRTRLAMLVCGFASAAMPAAAADAWRTYVNQRFGATADVPADWKPGEPPTNGDGLEFRSPDGAATLVVSGGLHTFPTIDEAMAIFLAPDEGEVITYSQKGRRSVTVSGVAGDHIFYRRSILSCHDQVWDTISIEYPASEKAAYDPLVTHVSRSLRSGESAEVPDCP